MLVSVCSDTGQTNWCHTGVSVFWHRSNQLVLYWCQCVLTQAKPIGVILVSVCSDTGQTNWCYTGVRVFWHRPNQLVLYWCQCVLTQAKPRQRMEVKSLQCWGHGGTSFLLVLSDRNTVWGQAAIEGFFIPFKGKPWCHTWITSKQKWLSQSTDTMVHNWLSQTCDTMVVQCWFSQNIDTMVQCW